MSVYRSQLKLLAHQLNSDYPDIEILTADRFQGRDKNVVIISLVRSNPERYIGELLQDWRRVNVAFTRARSKLIIFGSRTTIQCTKPLDQFVMLMNQKGWIYQIPVQAIKVACASPNKNSSPTHQGIRTGSKMARVTGGTILKRRPVLRDIVNEYV